MLRILSLDGNTYIELAFTTDEPFSLFGAGQISATCSLTKQGRKLSVEAIYDRKCLHDFGLKLLTMHRNLTEGASASLWSSQGNVVISLHLGERGSILVKCILVADGGSNNSGLHARTYVDQTYLVELANQVRELSEATTPWSN